MNGRVLLIAMLAAGCTSKGEPTEAPRGQRGKGQNRNGPRYLLGVAGQRGVEHCPDGATSEWKDVAPQIGLVPVNDADGLDALMGRPVLASGYVAELPESATPGAIHADTCSPRQARSDWVFTPRGVVRDRGGRPEIDYYVVEEVRPLGELRVRSNADGVHVEFDNPVPIELLNVQIAMHYEGCFGKPVDTHTTTPATTVGKGGSIAGDFAAHVTQSSSRGDRVFRAFSVEVRAASEDAAFDLDVELSSLGVEISCP